MAIYDFFLSRNGAPVTRETYAGHPGRLFYDDDTGEIRLGDGSTPGGFPVPITLATATTAGGVKLGPGVELNSQGQIIIDSSGLDFSFGDFEAQVGTYPETHPKEGEDYALLSSTNAGQDIVLASNSTGVIKAVGEFEIYSPKNGPNLSMLSPPVFRVQNDGQIKIRVPATDPLEGAVEIVGSDTGATLSPAVEGVMLHITGNKDAFATSIYVDGVGGSGSFVGRRYNNCCEDPTPILNGETITRWAASGYSTTGFPSLGPAAVQIDAIEDFVGTSTGTQIKFFTAALGTNNRVLVASVDNQAGVTATKFTGPLTGNADTATTATNLAAATGILAGTISIDPTVITRSTASVQTFTLTGLTTDHKIVVTSGTAIGYGVTITAAFASAADTLSIEFQNILGNQDIDPGVKTLQYFAWI
jgi:hypothetical protein